MQVVSGITIGMLVLSAGISGCSSDEQGSVIPPSARSTPAAASAASASGDRPIASQPIWINGRGTMDLLALDRTAQNTITARFRVTRDSEKRFDIGLMLARVGNAGIDVGGLALIDGTNSKRYAPLVNEDGECICSQLLGKGNLEAGESLTLYAVFPAVPAELRQITLSTPATPPFLDVPLGDRSSEQPVEEVNLDGMTFKEPDILSLVNTVEARDEAVDEDADSRRVRLSSDVLFKLNSADLSTAADRVLTQLASDIDASGATTVKIDGYTDTSGNDSINDPLSLRRAQSVDKRLSALVSRKGMAFQAAGHGSKNPVASNGSDHGRRLNRRVAVSYARPAHRSATSTIAPAVPKSTPAAQPVGTLTLQDRDLRTDPQLKTFDYRIDSVRRDSAGLVALTWSITNNSSEAYQPDNWNDADYTFTYYGFPQTKVGFSDPIAQQTYLPLKDSETYCLCNMPDVTLAAGLGSVQPKETITYYVLYKVPAQVTSIVVQIKGFAPSAPIGI